MHQIPFPLGLRSRPRWGSLQRSPDPLAVFNGPTSKGREREGDCKAHDHIRTVGKLESESNDNVLFFYRQWRF